ncbi:MAG: FAD-dependent tricarballylate dehydrogenase TcuA [Burkholderiales bacterium]|nr:FAD-dependent tricarballylate dehydrogenase TcuA [Burkholderiales bacterium]
MSTTDFGNPDVIVIGAGNAAACAALAARESGVKVIMLEAAPLEDCGGNSRYTGGLMRFVFNNVDELAQVIPDLTEEEKKLHDFGTYTSDQYYDDMGRITQYRTDPDLCELLITRSYDTIVWLRKKGVVFQASFGRQSHKIGNQYKFWGGLAAETWGGGQGLVENEHKACAREGIEIFYETPAIALLTDDDGAVCGVKAKHHGKTVEIRAKAVVLACGGFQSSAEMRARYLGPNWDLAKVRGTRYNTGVGIKMALDIGAMAYGHWSGCHAVGWDMNAPPFGDLAVGDGFQKHSYPWGIMVNARGERFVDEGADFRNYTYAKYGAVIHSQPGMFAWQIFDQKIIPSLRDEYRIKRVTKVRADTLEELVKKLDGVDADACLRELTAYNKAVRTDIPYNSAIKDGRCTEGLRINKTNWAHTVEEPPFEAYAVTCGVTFSFGGVKITNEGAVEDTAGKPIPGLYAAGELVGGIFYHNYPGGTGLTSGAVFGKIAGDGAAAHVKS